MKTGASIVYNGLLKNRVKNVFMYSGGAIMPLIDKFADGRINYYINAHEQNCGHAATGYAKSSGRTGVCLVTSGPGITNMVTPILDAQNDSTPLVVFSGQVPLNAMGTTAFQESPATEITKSITKWNYCVKSVDELEDVVDKAFKIAQDGKKGAVHIDLPKCVLSSYKKKDIKMEYEISQFVKLDDDNLTEISNEINKAERPVLYIGQGCNDSHKLLRKMAFKGNIPVTTTIHAMGVFDEDEELSLQFLGMHGNVAANYAVQESDCIIAIGSRFDDRTTGNVEYYAPKAKIIHVNIDKKEVNKVVRSDYNVVCPADYFLEKIMDKIMFKRRLEWMKTIFNWKKDYPFKYDKIEGKLKTQQVLEELNKQLLLTGLYNNCYITNGVGNHQMMTCQFMTWKLPKRYLSSGSLGVMGVGLPYAIGCQIANPNNMVIDIDGDGSFNHTMSDLTTISRYNLPVKIMIMNDGHQSMVRAWEHLFFDKRFVATKQHNPTYEKLGKAFGIRTIMCDSPNDLEMAINYMLHYKGPILCNFKVETDLCLPLVSPGKALDDIIMHGSNDHFNIQGTPPN